MNVHELQFNIFDIVKFLSFVVSVVSIYYKLNLKLEILQHSHRMLSKKIDEITKIVIKNNV